MAMEDNDKYAHYSFSVCEIHQWLHYKYLIVFMKLMIISEIK